MSASIGFRPTPDDERILREAAHAGETTSDTLRRALRLLDHERWLHRRRQPVPRGRGGAPGGGPQHRTRRLAIRGTVYRVDLGRPRGPERGGRRFGLVVSPSDSPLAVATMVPTSTSAGPSVYRPELEIAGQPRRMLVDQVRSVDVDHIVGDPVDDLTWDRMGEVEAALAGRP